ncbi:tautomerase family protein [Fusibacter sp. 3D3]|uniref:tautomerase family protein n=1 Tax=Fusibacter sp. 3D3 TaxID=1048380 RepID=UPI000852DF16|nr:tautomerase family protein [Fusibacter sp. 3D3]GAU79304.1 hypothetical protein F3D3_3963 [Fusibacter sp. 3D3]
MPFINITVGPMTKEKKKELIEKLVDASMAVTGASEQSHTVVIHEMPLDALSIGKTTVEEMVAARERMK